MTAAGSRTGACPTPAPATVLAVTSAKPHTGMRPQPCSAREEVPVVHGLAEHRVGDVVGGQPERVDAQHRLAGPRLEARGASAKRQLCRSSLAMRKSMGRSGYGFAGFCGMGPPGRCTSARYTAQMPPVTPRGSGHARLRNSPLRWPSSVVASRVLVLCATLALRGAEAIRAEQAGRREAREHLRRIASGEDDRYDFGVSASLHAAR